MAFSPSPDGLTTGVTMKIANVHQRTLAAAASDVGALIDRLASKKDPLWPQEHWPAMRFDRSLQVGARGGHGPIRYFVSDYRPGHSIRFTFTAPRGFNGHHRFELETIDPGTTRLVHHLEMRTSRWALLSWSFIYRPLHDALIEDAFAKAEASLGLPVTSTPWSGWVRWLRSRLRKRREAPQSAPTG